MTERDLLDIEWDEMIHRKHERIERGLSKGDQLWKENKEKYDESPGRSKETD